MLKWKGLFLLCLVSIAFQGCAVSSTDKVTKPGEAKSGFIVKSKVAEVTVDQPNILKKQTGKVIIGSFKVGFLTDNNARAVAKGGFFDTNAGGAGKATARAHLKGLTAEQTQKITNDIYQQFVQELKGKGYTVVSPEELAAEPAYAALQNAGVPSPEEDIVLNIVPDGKVNYVAPDGMKLIYYIGEKKAVFALSTETIKKSQALADKTGASVLAVNYIVNFVNAEGRSGWVSNASVKIGQGLSIVIGSAMSMYPDSKSFPATVKLSQAVYSEQEFAKIENVTSKAGKALGTAANMGSALLGGGTSQLEDYNVNIDGEKYAAGVKDIGVKANQRLIAKMAEARSQPATP